MPAFPPSTLLPNRPSTRRAGVWIGLAFCALLAGCASQNPSLSAHLDQEQDDNWLFQANYKEIKDPIALMAKRSQQESAQSELVDAALEFLGVRYRWGGADPKTGFDCSGLVTYAAEQSLGLKLPRNAAGMAREGQSVKRDELQAGDLVFFNTLGRRYSHVGIYVGDNRFVHAPSSGGVVRVENMNIRYWAKRYNGARRLNPTQLASK